MVPSWRPPSRAARPCPPCVRHVEEPRRLQGSPDPGGRERRAVGARAASSSPTRSRRLPMSSSGSRTASADEDAAPSTVALTLTATGLHGQSERFEDQARVEFSQRDYHVRYGFRRALEPEPDVKRRATTVADTFKGATILPRAARATASFPGAFAPIHPPRPRPMPPGCAPVFGDRDWLMDGGVLDNEPFDPVLREMRKRLVERGTRRVLAYVVPSTGVDEDDGQAGSGRAPRLREAHRARDVAPTRDEHPRAAHRCARDARPGRGRPRPDAPAAQGGRRDAPASRPRSGYGSRRWRRACCRSTRSGDISGGIWQLRQVLATAQTRTDRRLRPAPFWTARPATDLEAPWVPESHRSAAGPRRLAIRPLGREDDRAQLARRRPGRAALERPKL